jgi:squalene synthase HpnC
MSVDHYENFPVGSILLPARLRRPVALVYWFARNADDFADEGNDPPEVRLSKLEAYREALRELERNKPASPPLFQGLAGVIREYDIPFRPFYDLLDAFSQDVVKARYADYPEVLDYCARSANPVGRIMLHLYGESRHPRFDQYLIWSDAVCSALQLINFWQDVEIDYTTKNRIYLPADEMRAYGITESQIAARDSSGRWQEFMDFQVERARTLIISGAPLALTLRGRIGLELRTIIQGGLRILEKLQHAHCDMYRHRPKLRSWDWPLLLTRALRM